jgi:hypothetical protein
MRRSRWGCWAGCCLGDAHTHTHTRACSDALHHNTREQHQAQRALELRRAERARMDDLMRHPAQAPAPPRKPILRKGAGAVLLRAGRAAQAQCAATAAAASPNSRSPPGTAAARQRPGTVPAQAALSSPAEEQQQQQQQQQVAWRQGLQLYIAHQRRAAAVSSADAIGCSQALTVDVAASLYPTRFCRTLMRQAQLRATQLQRGCRGAT